MRYWESWKNLNPTTNKPKTNTSANAAIAILDVPDVVIVVCF